MSLIDIQGASLHTPSGELLWDSFSLQLLKGQICGIVGESGSGKSSLTKAILGYLPSDWNLGYSHWEVLEKKETDWRNPHDQRNLVKQVFYVPQNPNLAFHPYQKLGHQFQDYVKIRDLKVSKEEILLLWERMLLKSPSRIWSSFPSELSGGEKQRLCLSLGLLTHHPIFLLDEPTTGLDGAAERWFLEEIQEISKNQGTGVLLISHDLRLMERFALQITIMKKGDSAETIALAKNGWSPKGEYGKKLKNAYDFFHQYS